MRGRSYAETVTATDTDVLVVGGGILGCLTALHCARQGLSTLLIDREPQLWSRASLHNEGKVHLGLVYAAGSAATRHAMLRDAVAFAPQVDAALGTRVDWAAVTTDTFHYVVMPTSLLGVDALAAVYRDLNEAYIALGAPAYLGERLDVLAELAPAVDDASGLPSFPTRERAVDPIALRALVVDAIERDPLITTEVGRHAETMTSFDAHVETSIRGDEHPGLVTSSVAIDCRWESQGVGIRGYVGAPRNLRVKAALRARTAETLRTRTLVAGPFGDVVQHRDYSYLSWYPVARVHHEFGAEPSPAAHAALQEATTERVMRGQLAALAAGGWIPDDLEVIDAVAGFIVGEGQRDIDDPRSSLHDRAGAGVVAHGRVLLPQSLKFTSAPAAAAQTARVAQSLRGRP